MYSILMLGAATATDITVIVCKGVGVRPPPPFLKMQ